MIEKKENGEILYTCLDQHFEPKENLSPYGLMDKWRIVPVGTAEYSSNMIASVAGRPEDITLSPNLAGWYKIYLHMPGQRCFLHIKLTDDPAFSTVESTTPDFYEMEEFLWRCADMSGQSITLTRKLDADNRHALLAAIRFVPMNDEEVAEYLAEEARSDTKRLYFSDDMHNRLYYEHPRTLDDWRAVPFNYAHSDAEWLSVEQVRNFISKRLPTSNTKEFCFPREGDRNVQEQYPLFDYNEVLKTVVEQGHKQGLKMSVSIRMGAWGLPYPFDQYYFDCDFMQENPQWRTFDRNGDEIEAMSYAYDEVQAFMVDELLNMARSGCDAVTLIAHRGIPYVLFEKPVADRFFELYGEYPYELPLDDVRLNALHCDIMTSFFRRARAALDAEFGKGKIQIHLRALYSPYDTKYVGIDTEVLSREGLVDAIISYPVRFHEMLDGDIWKDEAHTRIDLDKYTEYVRTHKNVTIHPGDCELMPPIKNSRGELCGPDGQAEHVAEWMALEKQYGTKIYIEIMPRQLSNKEFKRRALDLYANGAERIALWDTNCRNVPRAMFSTVSRLGHKDELANMDVGEGAYYRRFRIYRLAGADFNRYNPFWGG